MNAVASDRLAPGWVRDDQGRLRRETKPHMGRRLPGFDYSQRRIYEITVVLEERRPVLGRLVRRSAAECGREPDEWPEEGTVWSVEPSAFGEAVLGCWREIARQAFKAGSRVITLANKGFSPLFKPGGKLFETCAAGNLLMLAPAAWPHQPAEKPMTRVDALVLNRIAQLIAGESACVIDYKGAEVANVDAEVRKACK